MKSRSRFTARLFSVATVSSLVVLTTASAAWGANGILGSDDAGPDAATLTSNCSGYNYDQYLGQVGYADPSTDSDTREVVGSTYNVKADINSAYNNFNAGHGVGVGALYFLYGLEDTTYTKNSTQAFNWGEDQGAFAVADLNSDNATSGEVDHYTQNTIFADIESAGDWYAEGSPNVDLNNYVWNGFVDYLESATVLVNVGVYSSPDFWADDFSGASVPEMEWTSEKSEGTISSGYCPSTAFASFTDGPLGGTLAAQWFGGVTNSSTVALDWQWVSSHSADYDQIGLGHWNTLFGTSYNP
jgi:hypothetical protein